MLERQKMWLTRWRKCGLQDGKKVTRRVRLNVLGTVFGRQCLQRRPSTYLDSNGLQTLFQILKHNAWSNLNLPVVQQYEGEEMAYNSTQNELIWICHITKSHKILNLVLQINLITQYYQTKYSR